MVADEGGPKRSCSQVPAQDWRGKQVRGACSGSSRCSPVWRMQVGWHWTWHGDSRLVDVLETRISLWASCRDATVVGRCWCPDVGQCIMATFEIRNFSLLHAGQVPCSRELRQGDVGAFGFPEGL